MKAEKRGTERAPETGAVRPMDSRKQNASKRVLSARTAATIKPGEWLNAPASRGEGVLQARGLKGGGIAYYLRTTTKTGMRARVPLGIGIDFKTATRKASELSVRYQSGERDLRQALEIEQREREHERQAADAAEHAAKEADAVKRTRTLGALLTAYADQLERDGKPSARSVRGELFHHVRDAWPKLWAMPVADVAADDLLAVVALPVQHGHKRQAEKVRAYLRAAFAAGMKARHNAAALPALRALRITANPARDLTPIAGANRARDRALSLAELRAYWKRIQAPEHGPLRFHLLTGCQRVQQLARATQSDVDADTETVRLLDRKGRRSEPRQHHVPLLAAAIDAMRDMQSGAAGPYLFTVTGGASGMDYSGFYKRMHAVAEVMQANDELPGGMFTPGDLRRTVETQLAAAHASKETRARLQSHGLSGVQDRHYNMYEYLDEMRSALGTLYRLLTSTGAKIVPIKRKGVG